MWAAAGPADDRELPQALGICDRLYIECHIRNLAGRHAVRFPITRSVKGYQSDTQPVKNSRSGMRAEPTSWGPVQEKHGISVGVAIRLGRKLPAVRRPHRALQDHPSP